MIKSPINSSADELLIGHRGAIRDALLKGGSDAATWKFFDASADMIPIIDGGEVAWTAQSNVTTAVETTIKKTGAGSAKMTIAAGFSTGLIATYDFTSIDLSSYDALVMWIRSDTTLASGVLQAVIDNTAACATPLETLTIPALTANTWKLLCLPFSAGYADGMDAVISVGLKAASDPGAIVVYADMITAVRQIGKTMNAPTTKGRNLGQKLEFQNGLYGVFSGTVPRGTVWPL